MTSDPWRYRCPNGHVNFKVKVGSSLHGEDARSKYYCDSCRKVGTDPHFDEPIDAKTGRPKA